MTGKTAIVTPLDTQYVDGKTWILRDDLIVISERLGTIRVPAGFQTDFNSIPLGLWNIMPPVEYGIAGVVHDFLYKFGKVNQKAITRGDADATHREFVLFEGASAAKARIMYWGLRLGGWKPWNAYRKADVAR